MVVLHEVATEAATAELLLPVRAAVDVKSTLPTFVHLFPPKKEYIVWKFIR
jgi:hypothetical protein